MTTGGWIMMLVSVGFVTTLFLTCLYMVLFRDQHPESLHGFEIDTPDQESDD